MSRVRSPEELIAIPSVLILRAVRTRAKSVALKVTIPSLLSGMFMATRRCGDANTSCYGTTRCRKPLGWAVDRLTLQATL